ncbi:hypothetical protein [Deminuibacter soli]|uniref:Outer membrane protein beta-barrel domain-containing protein n=1 Tax=Deminuibacter soli TaxID=2291815 RepID=A0A3E1NI81_9BACT|nr:hypothetical protein [Deminuibacter soli]RFM27629.1 hypothetical protein DXN05_13015 [Deminuibacter soli]
MKKLMRSAVLAVVVLATALTANAQKSDPWRLGIGVDGGLGLKTPTPFVLGGDVRLQKGIVHGLSGIFTTGYTHFFEKDNQASAGFIPVKAGLKYFPVSNFYVSAEAGAGFGVDKGLGTSFVWSPAIGYTFAKHWDVSVKYEDYTKYTETKQLALRIAYGFSL